MSLCDTYLRGHNNNIPSERKIDLSKKILVIFTGGTIGSRINADTINVDGDGKFRLTADYELINGERDFECVQLFNILSENISHSHWEKLTEYLLGVDTSKYNGIIITHGSDTLAYTSALLGMYFRHIDIPVFVIASNKPLGEKGSNGLFNFTAAVELIEKGGLHGVFTLYEKVMLPTRVIPADTYWDRFTVYGFNGYDDHSLFMGVSLPMIERTHDQLFFEPLHFEKEIMLIHTYPGMDFSCFVPSDKTAAVLIEPYHSATACVNSNRGDSYTLIDFIKRCISSGVMVYICGVKKNEAMYDTLSRIIKAGSIPLYSISGPAAYMKLLIAYNQDRMSVKEIMDTNLYFEIVGKNIK